MATRKHTAVGAHLGVLKLSLDVRLHSSHDITLKALSRTPHSSGMGSPGVAIQQLELQGGVGVTHDGGAQHKGDWGEVNVHPPGGQGVRG